MRLETSQDPWMTQRMDKFFKVAMHQPLTRQAMEGMGGGIFPRANSLE